MKKLLTILLSLVLVFCFISCSQPSNNPEDVQSNIPPINVQSVAKDPNVPASFTAVLEDNDAKLIIDVFNEFLDSEKPRTIISEYISSTSYSFKEDAKIDDIAVSGTLSMVDKYFRDTKKEEMNTSFTTNGNVKIGDNEYVLSDVVYSYTSDSLEKYKITGTITKDGEYIDTSSINAESESILFNLIAYGDGVTEDTTIVTNQTAASGVYYNVDTEEVNGEFSNTMSLTNGLRVIETTVDLKEVKIGETKHKLTAAFTVTGTYGSKDLVFDIDYLSLDGVYFTIDSVKNSKVLDALSRFLG